MKPPSAEELMAWADGQLTPERRSEIALWLAKSDQRSPDAAIQQIGDFVRAHAERVSEGVDLADSVMARVGDVSARPRLTALSGGEATSPHHRYKGPAHHRYKGPAVGTGIAFTLAAAAALVLWLRTPSLSDHPLAQAPHSVPSWQPSAELAVSSVDQGSTEPLAEESAGASIISVDFGRSNGSIFLVDAGKDVTPVVWLLDEIGESQGRMEPL